MHNFYIGDLVKITPDGKKDFTAHSYTAMA